MGRQAKRKQSRRQNPSSLPESSLGNDVSDAAKSAPDPNQFVQTMARQGYQYLQIDHSPDIPHPHIEPKV